jgi:hypothetical protein
MEVATLLHRRLQTAEAAIAQLQDRSYSMDVRVSGDARPSLKGVDEVIFGKSRGADICEARQDPQGVHRGKFRAPRPSKDITPEQSDQLPIMLLPLLTRLATSQERMADGLDRIAKQAHLAAPPMTAKDVAAYFSVTVKTVSRWHVQGLLKALADNVRPLMFDRAEVHDFARKRNRGKRGGSDAQGQA